MPICNSSNSRVLGFFSTLPAIWRCLQCIRRFIDTRHVFPHLVNAGKYSATILMYTMLSLWRIENLTTYKALFILFASVNTLYCCITVQSLANHSLVGFIHGLVVNATTCSTCFSTIRSWLQKSNGNLLNYRLINKRYII
jgi:EXS family